MPGPIWHFDPAYRKAQLAYEEARLMGWVVDAPAELLLCDTGTCDPPAQMVFFQLNGSKVPKRLKDHYVTVNRFHWERFKETTR